jgi:hypothetical protein
MRTFLLTTLFALSTSLSAWAAPITIDFESETVGPIPGDTLVVPFPDFNVTFQGAGLRIRQFGGVFPTTRVMSTTDDSQPITVTIDNGHTFDFTQVTNIINGTHTVEVDVISGSAFDASNTLLDQQTNSLTFHLLNGPGIVTAIYDDGQTGYVLDDFTFTTSPPTPAVVPEPASLAAWSLLSVIGLGYARRRRRRRS